MPATQVEVVPFWQEEEETARDLKSPGDRLTRSGRVPFLYAAPLHNNRYGIKKFENLQYTDADIFCRHAFINRSIAYDGASSYSQEVHLRELAKILENKIKEDTYDEQAIEMVEQH